MNKRPVHISAALCIILLPLASGWTKRMAPQKVAPVAHGEYVIRVNHETMGYVGVYDAGGTLLWDKRIYRVRYNPFLERDVQDVYISKLFMDRDLLIIANEKDHYYSLDLRTRKVRRLSEEEAGKYKGPSVTGGE